MSDLWILTMKLIYRFKERRPPPQIQILPDVSARPRPQPPTFGYDNADGAFTEGVRQQLAQYHHHQESIEQFKRQALEPYRQRGIR